MSALSGLYGNMSGFMGAGPGPGAGTGPSYPGYAQLLNSVLQGIQGIGTSQSQAIQDTYAQQSGQATQQMQSAGLGNSTVAQSIQRGLSLDKWKAQIALANQLAQLGAGYTAQMGMSGLQQQGAFQQQQLGYGNQMAMLAMQNQYQNPSYQLQNNMNQINQRDQASIGRFLMQNYV